MKKVSITGAGGFIGSHLAKKFLALGWEVTCLDNFVRGLPERLPLDDGNLKVEKIDIRKNLSKLKKAIQGSDIVYHLAAINGTENFYKNPQLVLDVGILGILNIMEACKLANVKDLVVASSAEVYQTPEIIPTPENVELKLPDSLNPRYSYGGSKIITELVSMNYYQEHFHRVIIFRPHNVYGPDMGYKHVVPQFILRALAIKNNPINKEFNLKGSLNTTRSFVYIEDIINGLLILQKKGKHREVYHIGNDKEVTINELANKILKILKIDVNIVQTKGFIGETLRRCPNINKIRKLGYEPKVSLDKGLNRTIKWYSINYEKVKNKELL